MLRITQMAEFEAQRVVPSRDVAMLSISNAKQPDTHLIEGVEGDEWGALLRVKFNDAEFDDAFLRRRIQRGELFDPLREGFPTSVNAIAINAFLRDVAFRHEITTLVVHCSRGVRRSGAVVARAGALCVELERDFQLSRPLPSDLNKTLVALLADPFCFDDVLSKCRARRPWHIVSWLALAAGGVQL